MAKITAKSRWDLVTQDHGVVGRILPGGLYFRNGFVQNEDFLQKAGATLPGWLATQDTSAAGSPTLDYVSNAAGGKYRMQLDTTNEVEKITLFENDNLPLNISKGVFFEALVTITPDVTGAGGALASGDKIVFGLASARNATLDSVATNAWFLLKNDSNIYVETDDGTTDNDDQDSGVDWASGTAVRLRVEIENLVARFYVDEVLVKTLSLGSVSANTGLQAFIEIQKAAAANYDHRVDIDQLVRGQLTR